MFLKDVQLYLFGEGLIGLFSLGTADIILRGIITFKICGMPSNGWTVVTKIVHHL